MRNSQLPCLALHLIQAIKTSLRILEVPVFRAGAASFEQIFHMAVVKMSHVNTLLATPSGERCQFNGITAEQSSCERFCLKFISGALVTLLSTVVSQIQRGIDI